jgi:hypothetical protein
MKRKELERLFPAECGVLRKVHLTHPTGADALDDAVMPDYAAVCELNVRSGYVVWVAVWHDRQNPVLWRI